MISRNKWLSLWIVNNSVTEIRITPRSDSFQYWKILLALESDQPIAQTARDLGVNSNTMHTWINKYSKPKPAAARTDEHIYDEIKRLKKALARMTQERDLLKKATAYFAKEIV